MAERRRRSRAAALLVACAALSGCGAYDPPVIGGQATPAYKTDLASCRTASRHQVYLKNAATPGTWLISPVTGPPAVRRDIRACLRGKGYILAPG